jgi:hypothetical protein
MRELNRLGITRAIDAGGEFQNFPEAVSGQNRGSPAAEVTNV